MDLTSLEKCLQRTSIHAWRAFDEIGSTNDEALNWLEDDAPDFSLVVADLQTRGRGRFERRWITRPGASLAFTVIFRPSPAEKQRPLSLFAPLGGLAVWQALHSSLNLQPLIKWPNDILLERKKCCGILAEGSWTGNQLHGIVLGIGINISADSIPDGSAISQFPATWVEAHTVNKVDRFELLAEVLNALQFWRAHLADALFMSTWQEHLAFIGEQVRIEQIKKEPIIGNVKGIDAEGNLLLSLENGQVTAIEVGDVHLRLAS